MPRPTSILRSRWLIGALSALCLALILVSSPAGQAEAAARLEPGRLWMARYSGYGKTVDQAQALAVSPDGSTVFVTGYSGWGTDVDYATVAFDAGTGTPKWVARYNGTGNAIDQPNAIAVSPDGATVFVTGSSWGSGGWYDYATVAYDAADGAQRWVSRYNGPQSNQDEAYALGLSPDGSTVFVTGASENPGKTVDDYATLAYDAATGARRWLSRYQAPSGDEAFALRVSPTGSMVFVTGQSYDPKGEYRWATVAYDAADGAQVWVSRYGSGDGDAVAFDLGVSPDGATVYVTGYSPGPGGRDNYATVAYDAATGAQRWASRYNGTGNSDDGASALGVSPDGSTVFVTGYSYGSGTEFDYATVAYDAATGARLWVRRYNGPGNSTDSADALRVSPDGTTVFVTGYSIGSRSSNYATVAYDALTGQGEGVARIGQGTASDLAVSPDDTRLFVTGLLDHVYDYGTAAYSLGP